LRKKYTCIIVDDEPKATELLADHMEELYPDIEIRGTYNFWKPAFEALKNEAPDILFLDIAMPQRSGMDLLDLLPSISSEVIFVTAYSDYALEAFERCAAGYILKPLKAQALTKIMNKILDRLTARNAVPQKEDTIISKLGIFNNNGLDYINIDDIIFMEAVNRYTRVYCHHNSILSSSGIGSYIRSLDTNIFFQVHRSFLINTRHVKRYERTGIVIMSNGREIPVSKNVREDFLKRFL
jgi:two-component system LytT family response regulator